MKAAARVSRASVHFSPEEVKKAAKDTRATRKAGWLEKRGPTSQMQWNRRWCILKEDRIIMYESWEAEKAGQKKFQIELNEYTKAVEFRKGDAPGDSVKHVSEKPFGFVIDTDPSGGPDRRSLYYLAADDNDTMNAWIVNIYRVIKALKHSAPPRRTSLAEFVALWQAPLLILAAPCDGQAGALTHAVCTTILQGQLEKGSTQQDGYINQAVTWLGNWAGQFADEPNKDAEAKTPKPFPLSKYFSIATEFANSSGCRFWESRIRSCTAAQTLDGKADLEANYQPAFRGPGEWNEAARQQMAIENSFLFCHWRGKSSGALTQAFINIGDIKLPDAENEIETQLGLMSQASAQGLQVAGTAEDKVRVVVVVSIAGGDVVEVQRKHIPGVCKDVLEDLKQTYSWADKAWIVCCDFPDVEQFVKSLSGYRCLVPDYSTPAVQTDSGQFPTSYVVHKFNRHPKAPSVLGTTTVRDIMAQAQQKVNEAIDCFFELADSGNLKELITALDRSMNVNTTDASGTTAMSIAAAAGHLEVVRELIARRGNVNSQDNQGDAVLACAVGEGQLQVVQLLLDHGADPKVCVSGNWLEEGNNDTISESVSLLEVAVSKGYDDIVELLTSTGPRSSTGPVSLADELLMK